MTHTVTLTWREGSDVRIEEIILTFPDLESALEVWGRICDMLQNCEPLT